MNHERCDCRQKTGVLRFRLMGIVLGLSALFGLSVCQSAKPLHDSAVPWGAPTETIRDGRMIIHQYPDHQVTLIAVPDTLHFIYFPANTRTVQETAEAEGWNYLVNAFYFSGQRDLLKGYYTGIQHVGLLSIFGDSIAPIAEDKQLTHIIRYDRSQNRIDFYPYRDYQPQSGPDILEIQTGPLVIRDSRLDTASIDASINGGRKAERTLVASIDHRDKFLVIVREKMNLTELGEYLLSLDLFRGKALDVIYLDGGSSTALYSRNHPELNFNLKSHLPFFLGVK